MKVFTIIRISPHFQSRKIFTIQGPYSTIRQGLRRRGWVEKFYRTSPSVKKSPRAKKPRHAVSESDDDEDDDDDGDYTGTDDDYRELEFKWRFST